jgi:hypothetical protein
MKKPNPFLLFPLMLVIFFAACKKAMRPVLLLIQKKIIGERNLFLKQDPIYQEQQEQMKFFLPKGQMKCIPATR